MYFKILCEKLNGERSEHFGQRLYEAYLEP
jgi:hypothetical protein